MIVSNNRYSKKSKNFYDDIAPYTLIEDGVVFIDSDNRFKRQNLDSTYSDH